MRILIADDDPVSRRLLESTLKQWRFEVVTARDGSEAREALEGPDAPRLAILDWMMPGADGVDLCKELRSAGQDPYTYVILLTGKSQKQDVIAGLDSGADDYVTKPFDPQELQVRLRAGQRVLDLMQQLISTREALRDLAIRDSLTGLLNRSAAIDRLEQELARSVREFVPLAVIMTDIDHFKQVNDTFGHMAGDAVLRDVARRFRASTRPYDIVGRYGGEEFLMALPGCNEMCAVAAAENLRQRISQQPVDTSEESVSITASIGVAVFTHGLQVGANDLIRAADQALYRAKRSGRDRVEVWSKPISGTRKETIGSVRPRTLTQELGQGI